MSILESSSKRVRLLKQKKEDRLTNVIIQINCHKLTPLLQDLLQIKAKNIVVQLSEFKGYLNVKSPDRK